ncbi:MAG TPA: rhamnogalacturonan acetylesterase [Pirellulales bacterium]|nr:rhamnogalacturonan acetylesterase [Pirellulales bacterium]
MLKSFTRCWKPLVVASVLFTVALAKAQNDSTPTANTTPPSNAAPPASAAPQPKAPDNQTKSVVAPRTGVLHPHYNPSLPTLFLIGDSTVKNGRDTGSDGLWGWGHPLAAYFDPAKINVENQALGGTSSRTYLTAGHWDRVVALLKPGDFVMMQFGHNDGGGPNGRGSLRGTGDETKDAPADANINGSPETVHTYGWYLRKYIADIKAKGATPIVCSLIPRNEWTDGKVRRAKDTYAGWAAGVAQQEGALFIDLNSIIADHYDMLGQDAVKPFFPKEHTHTAWHGALLNAQSVIEGIKAQPDFPLNKFLSADPHPTKPATDPTDG